MTTADEQKMWAYVWASKIHKDAVPLLDLKKGERFLFPHKKPDAVQKTCRGRGWYEYQGRKYRISTKTAVRRLEN